MINDVQTPDASPLDQKLGDSIISNDVQTPDALPFDQKPSPKVDTLKSPPKEVSQSEETITMWHCPSCKINNGMENERCARCN